MTNYKKLLWRLFLRELNKIKAFNLFPSFAGFTNFSLHQKGGLNIYKPLRARSFLLSVFILTTFVTTSRALGDEITVFIKTNFQPAQFEGLVTASSGIVTEKINPMVQEVAPNYYSVTFSIDPKEDIGSTATAVALSSDGRLAVGSATPIESTTAIPLCSSDKLDPVMIEVDSGTIRALTSNRLKRRDHNRRIFELSYAQFPSSELERVERNFGLFYPDHDDRTLNPFEMVERISRLLIALDTWQFRKNYTAPEPVEVEPSENGQNPQAESNQQQVSSPSVSDNNISIEGL